MRLRESKIMELQNSRLLKAEYEKDAESLNKHPESKFSLIKKARHVEFIGSWNARISYLTGGGK